MESADVANPMLENAANSRTAKKGFVETLRCQTAVEKGTKLALVSAM